MKSMIRLYIRILLFLVLLLVGRVNAQTNISPDEIKFVRQGVRRFIFDENQKIPLASLNPGELIGMSAMHPTTLYSGIYPDVQLKNDQLFIQSDKESQASIWFGGFNRTFD